MRFTCMLTLCRFMEWFLNAVLTKFPTNGHDNDGCLLPNALVRSENGYCILRTSPPAQTSSHYWLVCITR
jgi:hypothetical protein